MQDKEVELENNFTVLSNIPVGQYQVAPWWKFWDRGGWLSVERDKLQETHITWTTNKNVHYGGGATCVSIDKEGNLIAYYKSVISIWMIWGYGRGSEKDKERGLAEARWMVSVLNDD